MKIIKKNGKLQDFDMQKLKTAILNASSDAKTPLNDADANYIVKNVIKKIDLLRKDHTSSFEVFAITMEVLKDLGFHSILKEYISYAMES